VDEGKWAGGDPPFPIFGGYGRGFRSIFVDEGKWAGGDPPFPIFGGGGREFFILIPT
jgi:hypothetical protein